MTGRDIVNSCTNMVMPKASSSLEMVLVGELCQHQWPWLLIPHWDSCPVSFPFWIFSSLVPASQPLSSCHWELGYLLHGELHSCKPVCTWYSRPLRYSKNVLSVVGWHLCSFSSVCLLILEEVECNHHWFVPRGYGGSSFSWVTWDQGPGSHVSVAPDTLRSFLW